MATFNGTPGDDVFPNPEHPDNSGNDEIDGNDGDDTLYGGAGNDDIDGDAGEDLIDGGEGDDVIHGGDDDDTLYGGAGNDEVDGDQGDDLIYGGAGNDELDGDDGNDEVYGGDGDDDVEGDGGNDIVDGGAGNDIVRGNDGDDRAIFNLSENTIGPDDYYTNYYKGGEGSDTLVIELTQAERVSFQDELDELERFIEENANPDEHGGPRFTTSFGLTVRDFEALEIVTLNPPPVIDLDANDSTAPGFDVAASFVEEGGPVRVTSVDPDVVITDPDSTELTEAIVTLTNRPNGGVESLALSDYGQTLLGNLTLTQYDPDTGILKIEGTASLQQYASLLQEIVYDNTSENPDTTPRRVSFVVKDEYSNSNEAFSTLSVTGENDAPILDDVDSPVVFDENVVNAAPQILDADVTLDDVDSPDFDGGFLLVTYSTGGGSEDQLSVGSLVVDGETIGSIDPAADGSNGNALHILLNDEATRQRVEELIERLAYRNTSDTPTSSRTIQIEVNDGDGGTSAPREIEIQVLSQNDAPVLTEVSPLVTFSEDLVNAAPQVLDADVTLTDEDSLDFDQGHLRVHYTQGGGMEDQLSIPSLEVQGFVIGTLHPTHDGMGGNALQIDLNEHATALRVEALIERLSYQNTSNDPAETRTIAIEVSDGDGGLSTPREIEIRVEGDNEAPVLTDVLPVVTFEATTVTVVPQILDSDVSLDDVDSPNFDGGELLVTYFLGGENTDQLAIPDLEVEGVTIGTLHGSDDGQDGAALRVLLNDKATPARVETLIERLTYRSTAAEPAESRTIEITVEDDQGGISDPRQLEIRIEPPNEPPVLEDVGVETPFNEDMLQAAPQLIDSNVTLTDLDSPDFDTGWVLVQFLDGTTDDQLGIRDEGDGPGEIGFDGTDVIFEGAVIGTLDSTATGADGTDLRIFLNANATPANIEALIENITFQNNSDDPIPTRTVRFLVNDGDGGTSDPDDVEIQILGVNDAPVLTDVDSPVVFDEQLVNASPQTLDADVTLTDPDSADFAGGILLVTYSAGGGLEDQLVLDSLVVGGVTIGAIDAIDNGQNGRDLRVLFNSDATPDRVERLIERLSYQNTSDAPSSSRTIQIEVNDGDGGTSLPREIEIQVTPANDAPELLDVAPLVAFFENDVNAAAQFVDADIQLRDDDSPDFDDGFLLIRGSGLPEDDLALSASLISQVGGTLHPLMNGIDGADLRVEFDQGGAARGLVEQLIESLTYRNSSDTPTTSRTIHISVDDGDGGTSVEQAVEIQVLPENDRPVLEGVRASLDVRENDPATVVDDDVMLTDTDSADFDGGFLRIAYTTGGGAEDQLVIGDLMVGGLAVGTVDPIEDGTDGAALTIRLNSDATPERVEQLIERLAYRNTSDDPAASRTISIVVDDNDGGTSPSEPREVIIGVTPVNDAPVLTDVVETVGFAENAVNAAPQVLDADVSVSDLDSADFEGGYVLVTYAAGGGPENQLSVPSLVVDGLTIASIAPTDNGMDGASLRLLLNGDATQMRVQQLLETLSYQNTSNAPTFSRTIEITINDGDGTPNGGDDTSAPQQIVIEVNPQNDAPVLQDVEPLVSFDEQLVNAGAQVIDGDVSLEDDDSPDFDGGTLLIAYTEGGGPEDHLVLPSLLVDGFMVGTLDAMENGGAGANLRVHLNQNATPARIEQLLETLSYRNSSDDPTATRTIEITVNDGDGTLNGGEDTSEPRQIVIEVGAQNDAPVLEDVFTDRAFVEDAAPETLDFDVTLTDVDSPDFNGGYLLLEYHLGGTNDDQLSLPSLVIDGLTLGTLASDGSDGNELRVELNGSATPDRVERLIETITYQNTSQAPEAERTIRITVNDGDGGTSDPRDILVKVASMNDAPILTEVGEVIVFSEDAIRLAPAPIDSNVTVSSPDGEDLGGGSVLVAMDGTGQDQLSIRNEGTAPDQIGFDGITVTYQGVAIGTVSAPNDGMSGSDLQIDLLGTATVIGVEALIENLTYQNSSEDPEMSRTATITITDGGGLISEPRSVDILIAAINDAPELAIVDATASFTENDFDGGAPLPLGIDATLTDVDSADFEGGTLLIEGSGLPEDDLSFPGLMGLGSIVGADDGLMGADLRVLLNASATPAAVADLLDTLRYRNSSQDPTEFRTLDVTITDGDGGTSATQQIEVQVVPVNDAPELDGVVSTLAVNENDPATPVDGDVTLTDVDSADFAGGFLLVEYVMGGGSEDQLEISDLVVGGVTIGIVDGTLNGMDGQPLRIDLDAGATPDRVEMLIEHLTYRNSSEDPTATRTIRITVNDGDGTAIGGMDTSAPRDVVITVAPANDDPTIDGLGPEVTFLENEVNAAPRPVDMSVLVGDVDNANFEGGSLLISASGLAEDTLAFADLMGIGMIEAPYDGVAGAALRIVFNVNATPEKVSLLLESLTYANSSDTPTVHRDLTVTLTDGPDPGAGSTMVPLSIDVTPQNDVPQILDFVPEATFQEMGAPEVIDGTVQVIDPDMPPDLDGGFLMITYAAGGTEDDHLNLPSLTVDGVPIGAFWTGSDGADGAPIKVHFNSNATPERVALLLETLTFHNTSEDPTYSRTIQIVVDDGTMAPEGSASAPHLVELVVEPTNDAPVLTEVAPLVSFQEDDVNSEPRSLGLNVVLNDVDSENFDGGSLFISGSGLPEDKLAFPDLMGIGMIQPPNDGMAGRALEITLNPMATPGTVKALLDTLTYANSSDRPTFSRTIEITINDGDGTLNGGDDTSAPQQIEIQVEPVNDNPVLLSSTPSASFLENDVNMGAQPLALDVSVTDPDSDHFDGGSVWISYSAGGSLADQLILPSLMVDGVEIGTVDGTDNGLNGNALHVHLNANATPARVETLIETLTYRNTSNAPEASRTIDIVVDDGGSENSQSQTQSVEILIEPEPDAPDLEDVGILQVYNEQDVNATPQFIDSNVTLTDDDSADLWGGNVFVEYINGTGGEAQDQLAVLHQGNGPDQIGISGQEVRFGGVPFATIDSTMTGEGGMGLRIFFGAGSTPEAVEALIEAFTYQNTSDTPTFSRTVQITVTDDSGLPSDPRVVELQITQVNDAPVLTEIPANLDVIENDDPMLVASDVGVTDADSSNFDGGNLMIVYTAGGTDDDQLVLQSLTVGGVPIGIYDGDNDGRNGRPLKVIFNENATPERVQQKLQTLTYENTGDDPEESRTISITVTDGPTGGSGDDGAVSLAHEVVIGVQPVNDAPELSDLAVSVTFDEEDVQDAPQPVDTDVAVRDLDSTNFDGGFIRIAYDQSDAGTADDNLSFPDLMGIGMVDYTENGLGGNTLKVLLNSSATPSAVEALLQSLQYQNTSDTPAATRTIEITLNDGDGTANGGDDTSDPDRIQIQITPQNDAPTITGLGPEVTFLENEVNAAPRPVDMSVMVGDVDTANFDGGMLTITGGLPEDTLAFSSMLGIGDIDPIENGQAGADLKITFNANATPEQVSLLLASLTYSNSSDTPTGTRQLTVTLTDGPGGPDVGSTTEPLTIHVTPQNDVPQILDFVSERTFEEMGDPEVIDSAVQVIDPDLPPDLEGGFLMITYAAGGTSDDQLNLPSLMVDGVVIGTFEMGSEGANGTPIKVIFNSDATPDRVALLLETLTYHNTSEDPADSRTISIVVDDGTMAPEGSTSVPHLVDLIVMPMNDAPVLSDVATPVSFQEDAVNLGAQPVGLDVGLTDVDSENYDGGGLLISGSGLTEDELAFPDLMGIGMIQPPNDGMAGRALEIKLNAMATPDTVRALLGTLTYENSSDRPTFSRTLSITLTEADGTTSTPQPLEIQVEPVNDNPVLLSSTPSASFLENDVNDAPKSLALDVSVTDPDSDHFDGGSVWITYSAGGSLADQLILPSLMVDGVEIGTVDGTDNGLNGNPLHVHLNANATPARVETLIETLSYRNTSNTPDLSRTIDIVVDDGGSENSLSQSQSVEILIEPEPDAPDLEDVGILQVYNEQDVNATPQFIDSNVTLTDDDSTDLWSGNVFVEYISGTGSEEQDQLGVLHQGDGPDQIGVSGQMISFGGVVFATIDSTMTGGDGRGLRIFLGEGSTEEAVEALIEALTYQNTSDTPTFSRTVQITVTDDTGLPSDPRVVELQITQVNDAPELAEIPPNLDVVENQAPELVASDATVMDADSDHFDGGNLMIVYTDGGSPDDQLVFQSLTVGGAPIGTYDGDNDGRNGRPIKVIFNDNATPERVQAKLQTLTYQNTSEDPEQSRTISITVTDDLGATSMAEEVVIHVDPRNDAPVLRDLAPAASFDEDVVQESPQTVDPDVAVSDVDSTNFDGGFIRIEYTAGDFGTDDNLSFPDLMGIGMVDYVDNGLGGNALRILLNSSATPTAVEALLQTLQYQNTSDTPVFSRTISITIGDNDGDDEISQAREIEIQVDSQNDAPTIADLGPEVTFLENDVNAAPQPVDVSVMVEDVDSANFEGGMLTISGSGLTEDTLDFPDLMGIGMIQPPYDGMAGAALKVIFNANATPEQVSLLLASLTYSNSSDTPTGTRQLTVTLTDGPGGPDVGSTTEPLTIHVTPENDAPTIADLGPEVTFLENVVNDAPQLVDMSVLVEDVDSANFEGGSLLISGSGLAEDTLAFPDLMGIGMIQPPYDGMAGAALKVIFNANATPGQVSLLLESLTYANSSDTPTPTRQLTVTLTDGPDGPEVGSTTVPLTIDVTPENDAPTLSGLESAVAFGENLVNSAPQPVDMDLTVQDPDSADFAGGSVTISYREGGGAEDHLSFPTLEIDGLLLGTIPSGQDGWNGNPLRVDFTPNATPDRVERLLEGLQYQNTSDTPTANRALSIVIDDGDPNGESDPQEVIVFVNPENDAPVVDGITSLAPLGEEAVNADPQDVLDGGVIVSDVDSSDFSGGYIRIEYTAGDFGTDDNLSFPDLMGIGTLDPTDDGLQGRALQVNLIAGATPAAVEALLAKLQYRNPSDDPSLSRTVQITVNDGDMDEDTSDPQLLEIQVEPFNEAPVVEGIASPAVLGEEDVNTGPQDVLDASVMVSDVDSADFSGGFIRIEYTAGDFSADDNLSFPDLMGIGTLDPTDDGLQGRALQVNLGPGATPAAVEALLEKLQYRNPSNDPAFSRTVQITLNDGDMDLDTSIPRSLEIQVEPFNEAPVIEGLDSPEPFLENTVNETPQLVDMDVSVRDEDSSNFDGGELLITYVDTPLGEDQLALTPSLLGIGTIVGGDDGTDGADLRISLNSAATPALVELLLGTLTYQNTSDTPTETRTIEVTLMEADGTTSEPRQAVIAVTEENDAPTVGGAGGEIVFSEDDVNDTPQIIDSNVNVDDPDSANFDGGSVLVTYEVAGGTADERLSVQEGPSGIGMVGFDESTGIVTVDGIEIGTRNGGQDGLDGRTLRIDLNDQATPERVERLVERITYQNVSDDPSETRTVGIRIEDDRGGMSDPLDTTIRITPVNDGPILAGVDSPLDLAELPGTNVPATVIDGDVSLSDDDSSEFGGGFFKVAYSAGGATNDEQLSIRHVGTGPGEVGFDGTDVTVGGTVIGSVDGTMNGVDGADLQIDLNAEATPERVELLIEHVTYANGSDDPEASRTVSISVNDGGDDSGNPSATGDPRDVVINIAPDNDAPSIAAGFEATVPYTEGGPPVPLDASVDLIDPDSADFMDGEVLLSYRTPSSGADQLGVSLSFDGFVIGSIDGTDNGQMGADLRIVLNGSATRDRVERLLESLSYQNTSDEPTGGHALELTVSDGDGATSSPPTEIQISITPQNDLPVVDLNGGDPGTGFSNTFTEDGPAAAIADLDASITDPDTGDLIFSATLRFATPPPIGGGDEIGLNPAGTAFAGGLLIDVGPYDPVAGELVLSGPPTTRENYEILLRSAIYTNTSQAPIGGDREILVSVNDGTDESVTASSIITVVPQNDRPTVDLEPGGLTGAPNFETEFIEEGDPIRVTAGNPTVVDVDGDEIVSATITLSDVVDGPAESIFLSELGMMRAGSATVTVTEPSFGVIELVGSATPAEYADIIAEIFYANASGEPNSDSARTVTVVARDGVESSDPAVTTIQVQNVNDRPILDLDDTSPQTGFQADFIGVPVRVASEMNVDVSDVDDNEIESARIELSNIQDFGQETVTLTMAGQTLANDNTVSFTPLPGSLLELSGGASLEIYEQILQEVVYDNDAVAPTEGPPRFVTITVNDGEIDSDMAISTITVAPVMNLSTPALADLDTSTEGWGSETTFAEGDVSTALTGVVDVTDADGDTTLESVRVTLMDRPDGSFETVALMPGGEIFAMANNVDMQDYDPGSGVLQLVGTASHSVYETLLQSIVYTNTAASPTTGVRNVEVTVDDGVQASNAVMAVVNVTGAASATEVLQMSFDVEAWPHAYVENGVRVESLGDPGEDLFLNDHDLDGSGDLLQIAGGGPYEFSMEGQTFDLLSVDVALNFGTGTLTASNGASVTIPAGTGTLNLGEDFQGVTSVQWTVSSGLMLLDDMRFEGERPVTVTGTDEMDLLIGTDADETLDGAAGPDELRGGDGDDVLVGGEGDDLLLGEGGDDTLVFEAFSGNDTVGDFAAGAGSEDLLDLRGRGFSDAANVIDNAIQDGSDVVIDLGDGDSVRLVGTELSALHADDFLV